MVSDGKVVNEAIGLGVTLSVGIPDGKLVT